MGKKMTRAEAERRAGILYSDRATAVSYMADAIQAGLNSPKYHRANRLTRAERAVVKAAKNWHRKECLETRVRLMHAIDNLDRAKGGAR